MPNHPEVPGEHRSIRIWALLGDHRGDNNQVLGLAERLGLPFEIKQLEYRYQVRQGVQGAIWRWLLRVLPPSLLGLTRQSRATLAGDPPDLVIAIGSRSVPIVRVLQKRAQGRMRSVQLGNPRAPARHFDLVITTPQYPVADAPNVARMPIAISRSFDHPPQDAATEAFLAALPTPRRLLLIGGPTNFWTLDPADLDAAIARLLGDCRSEGGSLVVLGSPRTPAEIMIAAEAALADAPVPAAFVPIGGPPSYAELLRAADLLFVTADSVSMTSEALMTGKPVGIVPVRLRKRMEARFARHDRRRPGQPVPPRDLRYFWAELKDRGLVGTVEAPANGPDPQVNSAAVELVRRLLAPPVPPATDSRGSVPSVPASPAGRGPG